MSMALYTSVVLLQNNFMGIATRTVTNRIAVVFDFDETLTPRDSFAVLLEDLSLNADEFENSRMKPLLEEGWEKYLARAYCLVQESQQRRDKVTKERLAKVGQEIALYDGTEILFDSLKAAINDISGDIELEFYLISGGFVDIPRSTPIAKYFKRMWGCEFHYGSSGEIEFIKKQMTHVEKTRYLYAISKGLDQQSEKDLVYDYKSIPPEDLYIPLDQVIYIGDGASDVPCFAAIKEYGGISIGIYSEDRKADEWQYLESVSRSQRLSNLVPAGFEKESELVRSLTIGVEYIAKKITLGQMSTGE